MLGFQTGSKTSRSGGPSSEIETRAERASKGSRYCCLHLNHPPPRPLRNAISNDLPDSRTTKTLGVGSTTSLPLFSLQLPNSPTSALFQLIPILLGRPQSNLKLHPTTMFAPPLSPSPLPYFTPLTYISHTDAQGGASSLLSCQSGWHQTQSPSSDSEQSVSMFSPCGSLFMILLGRSIVSFMAREFLCRMKQEREAEDAKRRVSFWNEGTCGGEKGGESRSTDLVYDVLRRTGSH